MQWPPSSQGGVSVQQRASGPGCRGDVVSDSARFPADLQSVRPGVAVPSAPVTERWIA